MQEGTDDILKKPPITSTTRRIISNEDTHYQGMSKMLKAMSITYNFRDNNFKLYIGKRRDHAKSTNSQKMIKSSNSLLSILSLINMQMYLLLYKNKIQNLYLDQSWDDHAVTSYIVGTWL